MESVSAQRTMVSKSLGNLVGHKIIGNTLQGHTSYGNFEVTLFREDIIRVRIVHDLNHAEQGYAVSAAPSETEFTLEEKSNRIILSTNKLVLEITTEPVRFTLKNTAGEILCEDDPAFGTSWIGEQVTTYKKLRKGERFIGLGEKTGPLDRKGAGYVNWNTDNFAYGPSADPLYCSIPFYMGIHENGCYGIFLDNSYKSFFNFGASNNRFSSFGADSGEMDYYLFHNGSVAGIIEAYTWLTGRMKLPPLWSLGYQQCRYSYYPEHEVMAVADTFRKKDIPADTIVLDIHYMDKYRIFTFDGERFPDPASMIKRLREKGFRVVVIFDPGIKTDKGYGAYEDGMEKDVFIKYPDGTPYTGEVWPGWCHFPDFSNPDTREWWKDQMAFYTDLGISGFWNDMNEIATWGQYLPELMNMDMEGQGGSMRKGRNLYGLLMSRASFEGARHQLENKRPFNLTRAGFSGIQRYAAVWTGDNVASDEHMLTGVRLLNSMGLSGIAFSGYDVGGFAGNASERLFARWIQLGSFSPFFRGHSMINSKDSEPWAFGEEVEEISRNYIRLRYKLMGYLYSCLYQSTQTGIPLNRSLAIDYTNDDIIYEPAYQNQYLFGPAFLIAPVESYKDLLKVYLPGDCTWYEFFTDTPFASGKHVVECPIQQLPVFIKESSIIPVFPEATINTEHLGDIIEFHIYKGKLKSTFTYFEDDGETYHYEAGKFLTTEVTYDPATREIHLSTVGNGFKSRFRESRIVLHGFAKTVFQVNGKPEEATAKPYKFVQPISAFDPTGAEGGSHMKISEVRILTIPTDTNKTTIKWS